MFAALLALLAALALAAASFHERGASLYERGADASRGGPNGLLFPTVTIVERGDFVTDDQLTSHSESWIRDGQCSGVADYTFLPCKNDDTITLLTQVSNEAGLPETFASVLISEDLQTVIIHRPMIMDTCPGIAKVVFKAACADGGGVLSSSNYGQVLPSGGLPPVRAA